jgi:hypothetical protein
MPTEISANDKWSCEVFGIELGPLSADDVRRMVETGQLTAEDLVRVGSGAPWRSVRETAELRMLLKERGELPTSTADSAYSEEPPDEWYYRLDGRAHGALTLAALVDLIGTSGDTAQEVVVRHGAEGAWIPFNSLPGMAATLTPTIAICRRGDQSTGKARLANSAVHTRARSIRQFIRDNRDLAIGVAVWVLINVAILVAWTQSYATERKYIATLRSLEAKAKALQGHDASGQDWAAFRAHVKQTLAPIVADLNKRASASKPICQHLLWVARDQFPKCVGPQNGERSEAERFYQRHMQVVEEELAQQ